MSNKNILEKIDKYLLLLRYQYTTEEKLSRLHVLDDFYSLSDKTHSMEKLSCTVETAEQLGESHEGPLKVRGVMLKSGRHKKKYYKEEDLRIAVSNPVNTKFPLMLDHDHKKAGKIIGVVTKISYDSQLRAIRWWGHINDETFARNVNDGIITDVSATIYSYDEYDSEFGNVGTDLTFTELSLVLNGACSGANIEPDK